MKDEFKLSVNTGFALNRFTEIEEFSKLSVDPRKGREKLIIFRKNNKGANYELPVAKM